MTTTTAVEVGPRVAAATAQPWAGSRHLLRLYLRLDRVRIPVWAVSITLTVAVTVPALEAAYPGAAARQARAALMSNPSAVLMSGPAFGLDDYTLGAMTANELSLTVMVAVAIMSILLAVRHTRADEEAGRTEVLRALPVGRFAPATAAVLTVAVANLAVGAGALAALVGTGLEVASSVAFALGIALTGMVFGAVAAVTTQLSEHARAASGMAMAVLAVAFLTRGIGDIINSTGSWLSWFSPIAWAQQTRLYVDLRWWPLALSVVVVLVLLAAAITLAQRRDLGAGLRAGRAGPAGAAPALLSARGVARRLLHGSFLAWLVGLFLFGIAFGALARSFEDAMNTLPALAEWIGGGGADLTDTFAGVMVAYLALGAVAFTVTSVLRLRAEEEAGHTELMLESGSSRAGWLGGWLAVVTVQSVLLLALSGLGTGIGIAVAVGDGAAVGRLTVAGLAYVPAVLALMAATVALVGALPRAAGLVWVLVTYVIVVAFFGALLKMPEWAMDISPVGWTPLVPAEDVAALPLVVLSAVAVALTAIGFRGFGRRDLLA
ncbi:MAG: ABC transporter permease [Georgenia sp.]